MKPTRIALALAAGAIVIGGAAASSQNAFGNLFGKGAKSAQADAARDAAVGKAAWQVVAQRKNEVLGLAAPQNLPAYAPIYPDGLILLASMDVARPTGGAVQYDAAAPVGAVLEFYKAAAAQARLPVKIASAATDGQATFSAGDGRRQVTVKLTRQFANGTVVELSYS